MTVAKKGEGDGEESKGVGENYEERVRSTFDCKILHSEAVKDLQDFDSMNTSHNWIFQKSDDYCKSGVLVMCYCNKCGAEKVTLTVRFNETIIH